MHIPTDGHAHVTSQVTAESSSSGQAAAEEHASGGTGDHAARDRNAAFEDAEPRARIRQEVDIDRHVKTDAAVHANCGTNTTSQRHASAQHGPSMVCPQAWMS